MSFLKRLFGGADDSAPYEDTRGIYFYVQCDHCGTRLRVRADKEYDLNRTAAGYEWHKTIVDSKCFRPMPTVVNLDQHYEIVTAEIEGGHYITEAAYKGQTDETPAATTTEEADPQA
jgi:hypothetical protein